MNTVPLRVFLAALAISVNANAQQAPAAVAPSPPAPPPPASAPAAPTPVHRGQSPSNAELAELLRAQMSAIKVLSSRLDLFEKRLNKAEAGVR